MTLLGVAAWIERSSSIPFSSGSYLRGIPGCPVEHELGITEREEKTSPAAVGLTLAEGKALHVSLLRQVVTAQIQRLSQTKYTVDVWRKQRVGYLPMRAA
jgi:hypothetical protein